MEVVISHIYTYRSASSCGRIPSSLSVELGMWSHHVLRSHGRPPSKAWM